MPSKFARSKQAQFDTLIIPQMKGGIVMDFLLISLDKNESKSLYEQLYQQIKKAIIERKLDYKTKLPSKRQLADFLNISQTTVELAYGQLLAEGYIASKPRVGFFVEAIEELPFREKTEQKLATAILPEQAEQTIIYDFSPAKIDTDTFPFTTWRKIAKDLIDESNKHFLHAGHPQGEYELRAQIARYLYESRAINCEPEQIVIGSGTEQLLPMLLRLFDEQSTLALENPGYSPIPAVHLQNKARPIPVDDDGLIVEQLEQTDADLVYITPSHQFPTGAILSAARRNQLLNWARAKANRYIIEDDYDSEFRYLGKPIPALHSLDQGQNVIYMSTFSKSLMPSIRVAYFILPKALLAQYKAVYSYYACTVPRFEQQMLAQFMQQGHFSKHLNRMRKIYRKKHDKILSLLEGKSDFQISGELAGMHMLLLLNNEWDELHLHKQLLDKQIRIQPLQQYCLTKAHCFEQSAFILGFGGLPLSQIDDAIDALLTGIYDITRTP